MLITIPSSARCMAAMVLMVLLSAVITGWRDGVCG